MSDFAAGQYTCGSFFIESGSSIESTPGLGKKHAAETLCGCPTSYASDKNIEIGEYSPEEFFAENLSAASFCSIRDIFDGNFPESTASSHGVLIAYGRFATILKSRTCAGSAASGKSTASAFIRFRLAFPAKYERRWAKSFLSSSTAKTFAPRSKSAPVSVPSPGPTSTT